MEPFTKLSLDGVSVDHIDESIRFLLGKFTGHSGACSLIFLRSADHQGHMSPEPELRGGGSFKANLVVGPPTGLLEQR